ncbi:hypothetical protein DDP54_02725 [Cellulomonas sp. WB94]|uniref:DUF5719 family protein n=1 Tax=Cellulomonas sp. WB94 TaxID=2173174 RepID=UPI000D569A73|nr:DUF5719 family protein [Cellulomonas sp. WB94]PVU82101.1 hypothetical protein DDP54_02725 [Cellulomonas sp. WB94]
MTDDVNAGTSSRVWRGRILRATTAVAALGLVAAVVASPRPARGDLAGASDATLVAVAPPRTTLVCAGPLILPAAGSADSAFNRVPVAPVTRVDAVTAPGADATAATGSLALLGAATATAALDPSTGSASAGIDGPSAPVVVQADPAGSDPARAAGVTSALVTAGDLRGLTASSCQRPATDLWLVGGSTEISSSADLVIDNAGSTSSDVTVEVWGPSGKVELAGGEHVLVAPGSEQVVGLPGIAAEQRRLVVHLAAAGGNIAAHVQDSLLRGFTPAGTDLVVPGAAPATRQVVSGIVVGASTVADSDPAVLRVLVPGGTAATAQITMLGPDGVVALPGADSIDVAPGEVTDVPLGGLPPGAYTAVVDAPVPLVAAAMITRPGLPGELDDTPTLERAWVASATSGAGSLVAVPRGTSASLVIGAVAAGADTTAGGAVTANLRALGPDGSVVTERAISVAAGSTTHLDVANLGLGVTGIELEPAGDDPAGVRFAWSLIVTVTQADGELVSVLLPTPDGQDVKQVPVRAGTRLGLG